MTLLDIHKLLQGGLSIDDIDIFTEKDEAEKASYAHRRRNDVRVFSTEQMLEATHMILLDKNGNKVGEHPFCPMG